MKSLEKLENVIPNVLKRGARYFCISTSRFSLNDTLNYSSPCKLSKYLKQWKVEEEKSIFPYSRYSSIEEIIADVDFPPPEAFYNELYKEEVDMKLYNKACDYFNFCKSLPNDDARKMRNMGDWLEYYNKLDVRPLVVAMDRSFECFHRYFDLDATMYLSLPKIAMEAVLKMYDQNCSYMFTFGGPWNDIRQIHRENVNGGLVATFHRDINLLDSSGPDASRIAQNGDPYTYLLQADFNALYGYCQMQKMPTTPGVLWKWNGRVFKKSVMCNSNSLGATQWMYYLEKTHPCLQQGQVLEHFFHHQEVRLGNDLVDGYIKGSGSGDGFIFEYNGCRWVIDSKYRFYLFSNFFLSNLIQGFTVAVTTKKVRTRGECNLKRKLPDSENMAQLQS